MPSRPAEHLETAYYRYGPGRLPGADRRDVGGGYAFASVMAVFSAVFLLNQAAGFGWGDTWPRVLETPVEYATVAALVVACGFVAGVLTWRYLPGRLTYFPRWSGLVASVLTHLLFCLVIGVIVISGIGYMTGSEKVVGVVVTFPGIVYHATRDFLNVAVALYLFGVPGGYVYERFQRRRNP